MSKSRPVIVSATRTAIGVFGGSFKEVEAVQLGSEVIKAALIRAGVRPKVPQEVRKCRPQSQKEAGKSEVEQKYMDWDEGLEPLPLDEVIVGHVLQGGQGQNTARQSSIRAGVPQEINSFTVNKVCGSGMKAVQLAAQAIRAGDAQAIVAGGMENMSMAPYFLPQLRWGARMFDSEIKDLMVYDGLFEIFYGYHMGVTAENIAEEYGISRREQDELGAESHRRALEAVQAGVFNDEIVPVEVPGENKEKETFCQDERPMDTSVEKMSKLSPVFKDDGTVTAGNASGICDAAAALFVTSEKYARNHGLDIKAYITGSCSGGVDPKYMGLGPVQATRQLMNKTDVSIDDVDLIELNEAFASQTIACMEELNLDPDITNVYGSGIALGHPIGCTGARIIVTLLHEMERRDDSLGLASLCIGGGQGMAMLVERK